MRRLVVPAIVLTLGLSGFVAEAAQAPSPAASPLVPECHAPPPESTAPTPPDATPGNGIATAETIEPSSTGVPASAELEDRVRAAEVNLGNCVNARDWPAVAQLVTPRALEQVLGRAADPSDLTAVAEAFSHVVIVTIDVSDVRKHPDGRVSAVWAGFVNNEPGRTRDYFVEKDGTLLYDGAEGLSLGQAEATPTP